MSNSLFKIFRKRQCLTAEELERYIRNEMKPRERNDVERHLLDCELCSEALEGISEHMSILPLSEIKHRMALKFVSQKQSEQHGTADKRWWLAAAAFAGLTLISVIIWQWFSVPSSQLADSQLKKSDSLIQETAVLNLSNSETMPASESLQISNAASSTMRSVSVSNPERENLSSERHDDIPSLQATENTVSKPTAEDVKSESGNVALKQGNEIREQTDDTEAAFSENLNREERPMQKKLPPDTRSSMAMPEVSDDSIYWKQAFKLAEAGRYEDAYRQLTRLKGKTDDASLNFYKGLYLYQLERYAESLGYFEKIVKDNRKNHYYSRAFFYKGLSLIGQGRTEEGKRIMQEVIDNRYPEKERAYETLRLLK